MLTAGDIAVVLQGQTGAFVKQMAAANAQIAVMARNLEALNNVGQPKIVPQTLLGKVEALHAGLSKAGDGMIKLGRTAAVFIGIPLLIALRKGIKAFAEYEQAMRNVNSIAKEHERQFKETTKAVMALGRELGKSPKELAEALYDIVSAGFKGSEAMEILRQSTIGARAGLATTKDAAKATTAVLNAYGLSAASAADVNDILFKTVERGVITFGEMSKHLGVVGSTAAAAGVKFEEIGASVAVMTKGGIESAETFTSLNRLLVRIIKGTADLDAAFLKHTGVTAYTKLSQDGLSKTMQTLLDITGGSVKQMNDLGFEVRDLKAALALTRNEGKDFALEMENIGVQANRSGATMKAFLQQTQSLQFHIDQAKAAFADMSVTIGERVAPAFKGLLNQLIGVIDWLKELPAWVQRAALTLSGITLAVTALTVALGALIKVGIVPVLGALGGLAQWVAGGFLAKVSLATLAVMNLAAALGLVAVTIGGIFVSDSFAEFIGKMSMAWGEEGAAANEGVARLAAMNAAYKEQLRNRLTSILRANQDELTAAEKHSNALALKNARIVLGLEEYGKHVAMVRQAILDEKQKADAREVALENDRRMELQAQIEQINATALGYRDSFEKFMLDRLPFDEKFSQLHNKMNAAAQTAILYDRERNYLLAARQRLVADELGYELKRLNIQEKDKIKQRTDELAKAEEKFAFDQLDRAGKLKSIEEQRKRINEQLGSAVLAWDEARTVELQHQLLALRQIEASLQEQKKIQEQMAFASIRMGSAEQVAMETKALNRAINLQSTRVIDTQTPGFERDPADIKETKEIAKNTARSAGFDAQIAGATRSISAKMDRLQIETLHIG